jgi:hypothetical protein
MLDGLKIKGAEGEEWKYKKREVKKNDTSFCSDCNLASFAYITRGAYLQRRN